MAMTKLAVNGGSVITAPQWRDFWEKVELNKINSKNFQDFLDNPNRLSDSGLPGLISLSRAKKILGRNKIFTVVNYNKLWRESFSDFPIRYTEEDLAEAKQQNERGEDWRLVFYGGRSIIQVRRNSGLDPFSQPCFSAADADWYFRTTESGWANNPPVRGYNLVNFKGQFKNLNHEHQEKHLKDLGTFRDLGFYERTDPHVFTEVVFSIFALTEERIAENWRHWSSTVTSSGICVHVGLLDFNGYRVGGELPGTRADSLRVSICVKPR